MNNTPTIRLATAADAAALLNVYAPYVLHTANTFEYEVPDVQTFAKRVKKITAQYPWLLCEVDGQVAGYAYGSTHRERTAYQWSLEVTVYLDEKYHRMGIGKALYETLFELLRMQGYYTMFVSILSTNEASVMFHERMGFEHNGLFKDIGYKLGAWHTNVWMQKSLHEPVLNPAKPTAFPALDAGVVGNALERGNDRLAGKMAKAVKE